MRHTQHILMYVNNISWEVATPKYKEHNKKNIRANTSFKCILL